MIDLADLKAWLGDPQGENVDALLTALEARAVDLVENETERYFGTSTTHTEILKGDATRRLWLNEAPSSLTSIEERYRPGYTWTAITEGDSDGWELRQPKSSSGVASVHRKNGHVWLWEYEYRVVYEFGYAAGNEPPEIRQAVLDLVALAYRGRGKEGLRSENIGDYSYTALRRADGSAGAFGVPGLTRTLSRWRRKTRTLA